MYSRFQRFTQRVQPVFNLACLFSYLIQGARIAGSIVIALRSKLVVQPQIVACSSSYLGHDDQFVL